jgi:hypothetical protein
VASGETRQGLPELVAKAERSRSSLLPFYWYPPLSSSSCSICGPGRFCSVLSPSDAAVRMEATSEGR